MAPSFDQNILAFLCCFGCHMKRVALHTQQQQQLQKSTTVAKRFKTINHLNLLLKNIILRNDYGLGNKLSNDAWTRRHRRRRQPRQPQPSRCSSSCTWWVGRLKEVGDKGKKPIRKIISLTRTPSVLRQQQSNNISSNACQKALKRN